MKSTLFNEEFDLEETKEKVLLPYLQDLQKQCKASSAKFIAKKDKDDNAFFICQYMADNFLYETALTLKKENDNLKLHKIGYLHGTYNKNKYDHSKTDFNIELACTNIKNKHVEAALVSEAIDTLTSQNINDITVTTSAANKEFYEKLGFVTTSKKSFNMIYNKQSANTLSK